MGDVQRRQGHAGSSFYGYPILCRYRDAYGKDQARLDLFAIGKSGKERIK
jgi:hypothetical protein